MTAAKRRPVGRPKLPAGKSKIAIISVRFLEVERSAVLKAAKKAGLGLSVWLRATLLAAARSRVRVAKGK